jgi:hypothetical protein
VQKSAVKVVSSRPRVNSRISSAAPSMSLRYL